MAQSGWFLPTFFSPAVTFPAELHFFRSGVLFGASKGYGENTLAEKGRLDIFGGGAGFTVGGTAAKADFAAGGGGGPAKQSCGEAGRRGRAGGRGEVPPGAHAVVSADRLYREHCGRKRSGLRVRDQTAAAGLFQLGLQPE